MRRVFAVLLALVLVPLAAGGDETPGFRAVTINTPGQSGHVSTADFALRTAGQEVAYGPHMVDQLPLYSALEYKPGAFTPDTGTPDVTVPGARIYRDPYGVPAVHGDNVAGAWRGVGYAIAQDRLWQQHLLRMVALGRASELLGDDGLDMDIVQRRDFYTMQEYEAFYATLDDYEQTVLSSYAEGVNLWLAEAYADPRKLPAEIAALALPVEPWTPVDSLALGALIARSVASDGGQELDNARLLADQVARHGAAEAQAIFDDLLWRNDPGAPTSVPAEEGLFPSYPHGSPTADALVRSMAALDGIPVAAPARQLAEEGALRERLAEQLGLPNGGSNGWVIGPERSANGSALLFNGPQVGYTVAGLLTEFEIHVPGGEFEMHARGITVAGSPTVGIGYTDTHAWGLTSGLSDTIDLYVEQLTGPRTYRFQGEERAMDCRTERFVVKSTLALADGTPPRVEERELCRTVHGPVIAIDEEAGIAYSQRYAVWNAEIDTLRGLLRFPIADDIEEFGAAVALTSWNENTLYADAAGNIAYWHPGRFPARPRDFDERLPYPGTGEAEWERLLTPDEMPHAVNPAQGWLANWNSKPSVGWTSGDPHYSDRPYGQANRLDAITEPLADANVAITGVPVADIPVRGTDGIFAPDISGGLHDQTVEYFRPFLAAAAADPAATVRQRAAIELVLDWDGRWTDGDGDGKVDHPGQTIFHAWIEPAAKSVFGPYLSIGGFSRGGHRFEPSPVINLFLRALQGETATLPQSRDYLDGRSASSVVLATLDVALDGLAERFGDAPMDGWLADEPRVALEVQGVGPGGDLPFHDRGSWIEVVEYPVTDR